MNIITFDIEEWCQIPSNSPNKASAIASYDRMLNIILDTLDANQQKGTFFCVGKMGKSFPKVVKFIHDRGHEIGCHSNAHTWLNKMSREECYQDTRKAIDYLEQCIGEKVISYRAPAFSIGENNLWAFEVLAECGITRDSSIYPAPRALGGFPNFGYLTPTLVSNEHFTIKEFPIAMTTLFGRKMAYSGGGYFRFFPYWFIHRTMKKSDYGMCYFHIRDLLMETTKFPSKKHYESYYKEKPTLKARFIRYIKSNVGKKGAVEKLIKLSNNIDFVNLEKAEKLTNWDISPRFSL